MTTNSLYYKQRWEIVFLCLHPKGPQMTQQQAANYLHISRESVKGWLKRYKEGHVDDHEKTGRNRCTSENQDKAILNISTNNPELRCEQIATKIQKRCKH